MRVVAEVFFKEGESGLLTKKKILLFLISGGYTLESICLFLLFLFLFLFLLLLETKKEKNWMRRREKEEKN
jgi:hypothetical protein